ncbi:MAG: hypothetical protein HY508_15680 [Acidobacteria bacterium]|nr:hypothetical protein [Acidobacteriota bacterium]
MSPKLIQNDNSCRTETVPGFPVAFTSYGLGSTYCAKMEIHLPGAGARLAAAADITREAVEDKVLPVARRRGRFRTS